MGIYLCKGGPSIEEARAIREAVANATTLEEVERLNQMLKAGIVPGKAAPTKNGASKDGNFILVSSFIKTQRFCHLSTIIYIPLQTHCGNGFGEEYKLPQWVWRGI